MDFVEVNLADRHFVGRVFEIIFEQFEVAFVDLIDKMHRQIARYKGKRIDRWQGQGPNRGEIEMPPLETDVLEELVGEQERRIVRVKRFAVSPMDEEEAIEQMELLGHDFFVFFNPDSGRMSVLYRRKDGNYGLLEPELV